MNGNYPLKNQIDMLILRVRILEAENERLRHLAEEVIGEYGLNGSIERLERFLEGDGCVDTYSRYKTALTEIATGLCSDSWAATKAREALGETAVRGDEMDYSHAVAKEET